MSLYVNNVGLALKDSYTARLMSPTLRFAGVYLAQPKYTVLDQITSLMAEPKQVDDRRFERSRLGNIGISATINTRTASGLNLVITFADPAFQQIRERDIVRSSNEAQGRVINSVPGQITIEPWSDANGASATSFASADFAAATKLSVLFDASKDADSTGKSSLTYSPISDYNYAGVSRDAISITRDDLKQGTYERSKDGKFWAFAQENLLRTRFAKLHEQKLATSVRVKKNGVTTTGGVLWTVRTLGNYFPSTSATMTQTKWHDILYTMITESGANMTELYCLAGAQAIYDFQTIIGDKYITNAGQANTVGGSSVKGININEYTFMNVRVKIIHYPLFDDKEVFPETSTVTGKLRSSSSVLMLNNSSVETTQGMLPAFERFYYDSQPIRYYYLRGIVGVNDADPSAALKDGDYVLASNDRDSFTAGILCDDGIYVNGPERHGLYELIS